MKVSEYREGKYIITRVVGGTFYVWLNEPETEDFSTLAEARKWCRNHV